MTNTDAPPPPAPPSPAPPPIKRGMLLRFYHSLHSLDHDKFARRAKKYDAHIYALLVAFGVPLISWLITDFYTKLVIACFWFAIVPVYYFWLEGVEINSQIKRFGLLDQEESDRQRRSMYYPYFGVVFALVVWVIALTFYIATNWSEADKFGLFIRAPFGSSVHFGIIEWGILLHTFVVTYLAINVYYPLISNFLQATAGQKRVEKETVTFARP